MRTCKQNSFVVNWKLLRGRHFYHFRRVIVYSWSDFSELQYGGKIMVFSPFVIASQTGERVEVSFAPASQEDLDATRSDPKWQSDWNSEYLSDPSISA